MRLKNLFLIAFFVFLLIGSVSAREFERLGYEVAEDFTEFLDERVEDTLELANYNYSDLDSVDFEKFYHKKQGRLWYNIGSNDEPIEQTEIEHIYRDIVFIDNTGVERLKYNNFGYTDDLEDISLIENTEFLSETYFEDTISLEEGEVFIGKVMTWYTFKEDIFEGYNHEDYDKALGRDIMKEGVIRFSSPVYEGNELKGIVVLSLDYRFLQELSKHIDPTLDSEVVSSSYGKGYLLVFDIDGNTIIHPKPDNIRGYLEDGELAGYNEPNSTREGHIFNLYKYQESLTYQEIALKTLEEKTEYISSATDVSGRTKVTVSVPILYNNEVTNYAEEGVFGGIMMSITYGESEDRGLPFWIYIIIFVLVVGVGIVAYINKDKFKKESEKKVRKYSIHTKVLFFFMLISLGSILLVTLYSLYILQQNVEIAELKNIMFVFLAIVAFVSLLSLFLSYVFSRNIVAPIEKLKTLTDEISKSNFKVKADIKSGDEVEELAKAFNGTVKVLDHLDSERKQVDKAKTEFLSITSHELRSPMTPMRAQMQMLLGQYYGKLNHKQKESLEVILRNTERLDKIIVDFLEISRIEAARLKFNFKKIDLNQVVRMVVEEMKAFMPEKNIEILVKSENLPTIDVDPDRLSQILRNLVNNAIKFTPKNGKVTIFGKIREGNILFAVEDTGVGIDEKAQKKIFEPFYQEDNMYQHISGGTGLGLSIVRGIVESQNGKIWIESQKNRGTIFFFTIPMKPVKKIRPIKLLFSDQTTVYENMEKIFVDVLGPIGKNEFGLVKETEGISKKSLLNYLTTLKKKGILTEEDIKNFKLRLMEEFVGDVEKVSSSELISKGFIVNNKRKGVGTNTLKKSKLVKSRRV